MERSQDVRDAYIRWLEDLSRGTLSVADDSAFVGDGASIIGTGPSEWWMGAAARQAWAALAHSFRETGMRVVPDAPAAYAEGSIGWVVDQPTFRDGEGRAMQTRMTSIFRREADAWKVVHVHNSLGVPDEQKGTSSDT
jgi:ketosteroid isomerase-like protein